MSKKKGNGTLKIKSSYNFPDKDPIIGVLLTATQESNKSYKQIREAGGPAVSTQYAWFDGKTRQPRFCTFARQLLAVRGQCLIRLPSGRTIDISRLSSR